MKRNSAKACCSGVVLPKSYIPFSGTHVPAAMRRSHVDPENHLRFTQAEHEFGRVGVARIIGCV